MRKSIGGTSATSAPVHTATTPGAPSAAPTSTTRSLPCATGERTTRMAELMRERDVRRKAPRAGEQRPVLEASDPLADQLHGFIWSAAARTALMMF